MKLWIVRTPTGDRPYVSINKPQSYIDHLDSSGDKAEVFEVEIDIDVNMNPGEVLIGCDCGLFTAKVTRHH